jgi:hypothetical protein
MAATSSVMRSIFLLNARKLAGCRQPIAQRQFGLGVNYLALLVYSPQAVGGGLIAHPNVTTLLESVGYLAAILAVVNPDPEVAGREQLHLLYGGGVRIAEAIEHVGELSIFRRAMGIDDIPEGGSLRRRRFGVEGGQVEIG